MAMDQRINDLLAQDDWQDERRRLRSLILNFGLEERVKWGKLCYAYGGTNVVIFYGMKNYCALGFFKGSVLEDEDDVLIQPGENSQAMRQLRFNSLDDIRDSEDVIISTIKKAVQAEKDGLETEFNEKNNLEYPVELQNSLDDDPELADAFDDLTPGRQRGYVIHIANAKQSETRTRRIKKVRSRILRGIGINER